MAKGKVCSAHQKGLYAAYKASNKWATNRRKKLERALKKNPGNAEQIKAAMANISYRRNKEAKHPNATVPKVNVYVPIKGVSEKNMFKLRYRAHDGSGVPIWNS